MLKNICAFCWRMLNRENTILGKKDCIMSLYQIVNLGPSQWKECPEDLKKYGIDFVNENALDDKYPYLYLYWGWSKSDCHYQGSTNLKKLADNVSALPIVNNLAEFNQVVPEDLHSLNAFDFGKNGEEGLKNYILNFFGFINQTRKIFISYRRTETSAVAHQLFDALQQKGYLPFLDNISIESGVPFQEYLRNELADADVFVYLNSPDYENSQYTLEEKDCAQKMNMGVVQVLLYGQEKDESFINATCVDVRGTDKKNDNISDGWINAIVLEIEKRRAEFFRYRRKVLIDAYRRKNPNVAVAGIQNDLLINANKAEVASLCLHIPKSQDLQKADEALNSLKKKYKKILLYDKQFCRRDISDHLSWLNQNLSNVIQTRDINA